MQFFFLFIGQDATTWSANICMQKTVCSVPSKCILLQIMFCSWEIVTTLWVQNGSSLRCNVRVTEIWKKKLGDRMIKQSFNAVIEKYRALFVSVSRINYLLLTNHDILHNLEQLLLNACPFTIIQNCIMQITTIILLPGIYINPEVFFYLEIWRVDWGEIETREECDLDLPWVSRMIEVGICVTTIFQFRYTCCYWQIISMPSIAEDILNMSCRFTSCHVKSCYVMLGKSSHSGGSRF